MRRTVSGSIYEAQTDRRIRTEIELDGTIARTITLTFASADEAQQHKTRSTLRHLLAFYEADTIDGCQVRLRRKP